MTRASSLPPLGACLAWSIPLGLAFLAVSSLAGAQLRVEEVVTATADARDLAQHGERVLAATEGGLVVLRGGAIERTVGPREGLPGARTRSVSVTDEGVWVGAVEGTALLDGADLRVVRTLELRRVRRAARFAGGSWLASFGDGLHRVEDRRSRPCGSATRTPTCGSPICSCRATSSGSPPPGSASCASARTAAWSGASAAGTGSPADYVWRLVPHGDRVLAATIDGVAEIDASGIVQRSSPIARAARALPVRDVRDLAVTSDTLWMAAFGRGVFRAPLTGGAPRPARGSIAEPSALLATGGAVLVAHAGGVHSLGERAAPVIAGGLPSGDVTALARAFGTLWVGTFGHGLARLRGGAFEAVTSAHERFGVDRRVNDLAAHGRGDAERLWIATDRGLYVHDGRVFSAVEDPRGPGRVHVTSLHVARSGALWVASTRQLCRFERERWRCWSGDPTFPVAQLHAVTTDARDRVWVGSLHGLYRFDPARGTFARHTVSSGDLPVDWVTALVPWGDGVMAGTYHGGLAVGDGRFRTIGEGDGLPSGWVNPHALRRVGDEVWIGTLERGLVLGRPGAWQHVTTAQGLPSDDVTDVLADGEHVWVATRGGLARVSR
ncbi:MAG: hypothetical protein M5U28_30475 [Sandaracinaceae bacterium]|nr:hypothetical protein [Sandaracinaceae bacterium]